MKVMVTGADGLLGSNLVRALLESGYEVRAMIYPQSRSTTLDGLDIERVAGDVLDARAVDGAVEGCDAVMHCAASTALWPPKDPKITAINEQGTVNVLASAEKHSVKRMVHVGSASSYGFGTKQNPGTEESPYAYEDSGLAYFQSKHNAQKLVLSHVEQGKIDAVVVNPTFMLGPNDFGPSSGRLIARFVDLQLPIYPPGGRNFVDVRDVARGMVLALEKGKTGDRYLLGHRNMNMKEFFDLVAEIAGVKKPRIPAPVPLVMFTGVLGSLAAAVTKKPPEVSIEIARNSCTGCYYSAGKAVADLGLPQSPIETAVEDSYRWLKDNGYIKRT
ncbi:MAG TPA: SDR family oxidoreductase [bacterium]|nr:SDR family oxidoreductase [bacterium]